MKVTIHPPKDYSEIKAIVDLSHTFKLSTKAAKEFFDDNVDVIPSTTIIISKEECEMLESRGWTVHKKEPDFDWLAWHRERDEALRKAEEWVATLSEEEKAHIEVLKTSMIPMAG
jgi:hypothetical protein